MKPKWIIEHIFSDDIKRLIQSLSKSNTEHIVLSHHMGTNYRWTQLYPDKECIITQGSIQFGKLVPEKTKWIPGHWENGHKYLCSVYYPHFKEALLNYEYMILPLGDLLHKKSFIYHTMGEKDCVFIRPDSNQKEFTGRLVERERFDKTIDIFKMGDVPLETPCLICRPYNIEKEWRFFIADKKIVCGSQYQPNQVSTDATLSIHDDTYIASKAAEEVLDGLDWEPDRVWVLDMCKTKGGRFKVLEIGSFSSAGFYKSNTDLLVAEVNKIALEEWEKRQPKPLHIDKKWSLP